MAQVLRTMCVRRAGWLGASSLLALLFLQFAASGATTGRTAHVANTFLSGPPGSHARRGGDTCSEGRSQDLLARWGAASKAQCKARTAAAGKGSESSRWIVRFTGWQRADIHHVLLTRAVAGEGTTWTWIERRNAASQHPTDFGLLSIPETFADLVLQRVRGTHGVRDVHPDRQLLRQLKWAHGQLQEHKQGLAVASEGDGCAGASEHGGNGGCMESNEELLRVSKRPGRLSTSFMMDRSDLEDGEEAELEQAQQLGGQLTQRHWPATHRQPVGHDRQLLVNEEWPYRYRVTSGGTSATPLDEPQLQHTGPDKIWKQGYTGSGVRVGVFDTGIRGDHPHIRNIKERTNWTHQDSLADGLGHGTFVAGVISSQDGDCPGLAPDVELYTFKVFTDDQVSFTSWFLDAFNYAMLAGIHVINLSIGGPDFMDLPFVEKVWEITSSGILMVSAIGNDGPLYGTLNNPADQSDVIGVGGIDDTDAISSFSSRGMTSWELTLGAGRVKPDVMAYSKDVHGSRIQGGCKTLSGTSVASPVVAGAVCLLASTVPEAQRWTVLNPASMKQALIEGADRLPDLNVYEQGAGRINLQRSMAILNEYQPRASVVPSELDLTDSPYMWPYSSQPLYAGALPLIFNATVLNALGVYGKFEDNPEYFADDDGGALLHFSFEYSETLWPWSGYLAMYIRVREAGRLFSGSASGKVVFKVVSPPGLGEASARSSTVVLPVKALIQPTPPRAKRIIWDQFHSIKYPPGYIPRDNLDIRHDILDWHGDHLFTNFHSLYDALRSKGYFLEVLTSPATCFNASMYGALLLVDSEEEFYQEEVAKLAVDVRELGMNLIVFAEWYHVESMKQMRFYDDNTRSWWTPVTGGSNAPALNDLLAPYNISLGDSIVHGTITVAGMQLQLSHGADIATVPAGSYVHTAPLHTLSGKSSNGMYTYLSVTPVGSKGGHVAVFSDSNCLDSSHQVVACYEFLAALLTRVIEGTANGIATEQDRREEPWLKHPHVPLQRRTDVNFTEFSFVLKNRHRCYGCSHCDVAPAGQCSGYLDSSARSARLTKAIAPSTNVLIPYNKTGRRSHSNNPSSRQPSHDKLPRHVSVKGGPARLSGNATIGLVLLICVVGLLLVGLITQWGKGRARGKAEKSDRVRRISFQAGGIA